MNQVILVAHGRLATEMKKSAEMLFGELTNFHTIEFLETEGLDTISQKIFQKMKALNQPTLIFADLFGGTPFNASCALVLKHPELELEVVSGMSLPLVLEIAAVIDQQPLKEIASSLPMLANDTVKQFKREPLNINTDEEELE
ncbi:PTS sugar transporter subunit IIA [Streptococcus caviae]|uniref:PTS sugar transporter subunit IIA n=1 Tax=Streptococcus sp. 'caviae' TaxID=1915004 RepID=UPI00094B8316|nr:PTS sugar transporter subunit IIA [Streptococcus sp. 'caviae']OLN82178.1 PTS mannose/fructose/sorbose family IIA subunit [Streptococcus sp. 'caviae']